MKNRKSSEITNRDFWKEYWSNIKLPISVDYNFKNDRVIAEIIKKSLDLNERAHLLIPAEKAEIAFLESLQEPVSEEEMGDESEFPEVGL
jgi:hypothetical protein